jgi:hypothetical protein
MRKLLIVTIVLLAALPAWAQPIWNTFTGPLGEAYSRMGTDGTDLYFTANGSELHKYSGFSTTDGTGGTWTQLTPSPRVMNDWDSYKGLAYQNGYLYSPAIPDGLGGRTLVRYSIAGDSWEVWQDGGGTDLNICNTSGNGLIMDPALDGVGYSAWHAGSWWVTFDWDAQTANNNWASPNGKLGVANDGWVSRNEDAAYDSATGWIYSPKNDWTVGLSDGDVIYKFTLAGGTDSMALVAQKPWEAGWGQSLEFVPAGHALNQTGSDELWLFRGTDSSGSPYEGWGNSTYDYEIYDLVLNSWDVSGTTPERQAYGSESVQIGDLIFLKGAGLDGIDDGWEGNDLFMVASISGGIPGDVDGNGVVDGLDLTAVLTAWETIPGDLLWNENADLDDNNVVNGLDLTEVISNWTVAAAAEPEALTSEADTKTNRGRGNVNKGKAK